MKTDTFAARLLALRERAGISRYRLARLSGVTAPHLLRLERGDQRPSLEVAQKIARGLGTTLAAWDGCS